MQKESGNKLIANNKKAYYDYFIEDKYEAGLVLHGTEVKSLREANVFALDFLAIAIIKSLEISIVFVQSRKDENSSCVACLFSPIVFKSKFICHITLPPYSSSYQSTTQRTFRYAFVLIRQISVLQFLKILSLHIPFS